MSLTLQEAIHASVSETFENMAFMEVTIREDPLGIDEASLTAALLILEPFPGEVQLTLPELFLKHLTEVIYGFEEDSLTEAILNDLLMEILNTVAGRFLTHLLPPDRDYRLGLPETGSEGIFSTDQGKTWIFECEGFSFALSVRGEELLNYSPAV